MMPTATCQYSGWNGPTDRCGPMKNAWERVQPGDAMPAGECPKCNASALIDDDSTGPRIEIVTVPAPERATHFGVRSTAQSLANVMSMARSAYSYRVQDMDSHGFRVAVYRPSPYPPMLAEGYLRIEPA